MTEIPHLNIDELYERKKEVDTNRLKLYNNYLLSSDTILNVSVKSS